MGCCVNRRTQLCVLLDEEFVFGKKCVIIRCMMTKKLDAQEHRNTVRRMFGRIAERYDVMNRLMTFGQDVHWRQEAVQRLEIPSSATVLDAGAGTGDIALQILDEHEDARVVASDLTPEMIVVGRQRPGAERILWVVADAQHLPFAPETFSAVVSGYLLRNVPDLALTLREQFRVLRKGGRMVALDTTPPRRNLLLPFLTVYLKGVIPLLGRLIAGDAEAYTYLPDSTRGFLAAESLAEEIQRVNFRGVGFVRRMLGSMAIHWGYKPKEE